MLVDLGRNDVGRVAAVGIGGGRPSCIVVERYSHVMHIVSQRRRQARARARRVRRVPCGVSRRHAHRARRRSARWRSSRSSSRCAAASTAAPSATSSFTGNMDTAIAIRTLRHARRHASTSRRAPASSPTRSPSPSTTRCVNKARGRSRRGRDGAHRDGRRRDVLMIDNYDSFTYNLVQYLGELGARASRSTATTRSTRRRDRGARARRASSISPGPCTPNEAGISMPTDPRVRGPACRSSACASATSRSAQAFGGEVVRAGAHHARQDVADPPRRARRSSRVCRTRSRRRAITRSWSSRESLPDVPRGDARGRAEGEIMGVRHKQLAVEGVQFHPESHPDDRRASSSSRTSCAAARRAMTAAIVRAIGRVARRQEPVARPRWRRSIGADHRGAATPAQIGGFAVALRGEGRDRRRARRRRARDAQRARRRSPRPRPTRASTPAAPAATAPARSTSRPRAAISSRPRRRAPSRSTATARVSSRAAAPTCSRRSASRSTPIPADRRAVHPRARHRVPVRARASTRRCGTRPAPRRELGMRTIFNVLGPLTNPARVRASARRRLRRGAGCEPLAAALGALGVARACGRARRGRPRRDHHDGKDRRRGAARGAGEPPRARARALRLRAPLARGAAGGERGRERRPDPRRARRQGAGPLVTSCC